MGDPFPPAVLRLFWEVDPATVDVQRHADYVMERVMLHGTWDAMRWLRQTYAPDRIAEFLRRKGDRLPPRDLAYWAVVAGHEVNASPGGARPSWAGP